MGNFECNSIEDLVFSRSFRDWVLSGGSSEAAFWEAWIGRNPGKLEMVQHSKAIIYALQVNRRQLSEADIELEIKSILQRLRSAPVLISEEGRLERRRNSGILPFRGRRIVLPGIAALAMLVFLVGFILHYYRHPHPADLYESFLADNKHAVLRQQTSEADSARNIDLPDGSRVRLSGGSRLSYAADLSAGRNRREVYLIGEAFFEIKKNVSRPFYVLTPNLITKVLGTSFRVRAYPADTMDRVAVRTGKVSVFRKNDFNGLVAGGNESGGMVVTPNQVIVYDRLHNELNKLLTEQPEKLPEAKAGPFVFEATPVSRVFRMLQDAYGIPIVYDEDVVSSCSLSATMGNESFYEKLNIICKAINASYEVIDGNIVITASGCK